MLLRYANWGLGSPMTDDVFLLPQLVVHAGPMQGASFRLRGETCLIGRDDGVDVLIEDFRVSRRHAVIERTGDRLMLADAGSTNGTWLNDVRLTEAAELRDGDRIRLGSVELRFYDPGTASTEPVGAAIHAVTPGRPSAGKPANDAAAPTDALFGPTLLMDTRRQIGTAWPVLATLILILLAGGAIWAFLIR